MVWNVFKQEELGPVRVEKRDIRKSGNKAILKVRVVVPKPETVTEDQILELASFAGDVTDESGSQCGDGTSFELEKIPGRSKWLIGIRNTESVVHATEHIAASLLNYSGKLTNGWTRKIYMPGASTMKLEVRTENADHAVEEIDSAVNMALLVTNSIIGRGKNSKLE